MKAFIRSTSCISPQQSFDHEIFNSDVIEYTNNSLTVVEPDYKNILDARQMRRMSHIVRIGLATALTAVKEAGLQNVDAITTGTAYGCMEDSENFLKKIVEQDEQMLSPTAFIQSTHNTVGATIALSLKCHQYNNTFVQRGFSFEHALMDALLLLHENKAQKILTGSADEMTNFTFDVLKRFGLYKQSSISNLDLYKSATKGSIAGEGAAFFVLSNEASANDYAQIEDIETLYKPKDVAVAETKINGLLKRNNLSIEDVDLFISGRNGDVRNNAWYDHLEKKVFKNTSFINFKHLCGEYPTAISFALWLAANIIKSQQLPKCFTATTSNKKSFKKILIYNFYQGKYHSIILLSDK